MEPNNGLPQYCATAKEAESVFKKDSYLLAHFIVDGKIHSGYFPKDTLADVLKIFHQKDEKGYVYKSHAIMTGLAIMKGKKSYDIKDTSETLLLVNFMLGRDYVRLGYVQNLIFNLAMAILSYYIAKEAGLIPEEKEIKPS
jgi:3-deoxy-D-manno-octulosonate 8-phosphate phosphatase KdsC-like HAD superfamily phosphatase